VLKQKQAYMLLCKFVAAPSLWAPTPVHEVQVSDFSIMKTEVTQKDYAAIMGKNPASCRGMGDAYPVYNVSWYDAVAYANGLSERDGLKPCYTISGTDVTCDWSADGWRLPTEAEWEYAARGGSMSKGYTYAGSNDVNAVAWILPNSWASTRPVGTKAPNELGLYDMSGNVWEWVWDSYGAYASGSQTDPRGAASGPSWADRGGGWSAGAEGARAANRGCDSDPAHRDGDLGFRLVRPGSQ
jgi:formylglycine-generating enzyme required for sulfatase activity